MSLLSWTIVIKWNYVAIQSGVERGDVLDELCGDPVLSSTHGRVNKIFEILFST